MPTKKVVGVLVNTQQVSKPRQVLARCAPRAAAGLDWKYPRGGPVKDYLSRIDPHTLGLPGMRCRDITPIFADPGAFSALLEDLLRGIPSTDFDVVVGIEALGFILATAIAVRTGKGLVPIRKAGKLPVRTETLKLPPVRGQERTLELRADALAPGRRVLLVDDWIKSGTQIAGALELLGKEGAEVAGVIALNVDTNDLTRSLLSHYPFHTVFRDGKPLTR